MAELYSAVARILTRAGWRFLRAGKGSHEIWTDASGRRRVTGPRSSKSPHMMNEVLKQAGLPKAF